MRLKTAHPLFLAFLGGTLWAASPAETNVADGVGTNVFVVDLPTVLQLAGGRNLDVQIVRARVAEARANNDSALWQFFPAIVPGVGYRRHDNLIQDVAGHVIEVHKDSYTVGPTFAAQVDVGDAIYKRLAAQQVVTAAEAALAGQRAETALSAALGFFDLARAQASVGVAAESVRMAQNFAAQVAEAVVAGIAFKGDALRAEVQADRNRLVLRQAQEQVALAAARLARTLHLGANVTLVTPDADLVPLALMETNAPVQTLLAQALAARPEMKQSRALVEAARHSRDGAKYGPLVPSLGAQVFAGGLGGGIDGESRRFGESQDYQFTLGWRVGPGGLFDRGRVRAGEARLQVAQLTDEKVLDDIIREVAETHARLRSLADQLGTVRHAVQTAGESLKLAAARQEFAVGLVLERLQAEQDLTRARLDYLDTVAEFNKVQFTLRKAVGATDDASGK